MDMKNFVKEAEVVDSKVDTDATIRVTDHLVDKVINLIKHRHKKPTSHEKVIIDKLKEGGIA